MTGAGTTPTFDATKFSGNGSMTWTVVAGNVKTLRYYMVDAHTMRVTGRIVTTTVGGTPAGQLRIDIPEGKMATKTIRTDAHIADNGTRATGRCQVTAGASRILIQKLSGNWGASTILTEVDFQITFET